MSVALRNLLQIPALPYASLHSLPGAGNPSLSHKTWVSGYAEVTQARLIMSNSPDWEELRQLFGDEDDLDRLLLSTPVHPLNDLQENLQSEGDSARTFYTHQIITQRSEAGPLGSTNVSQTVDCTWSHKTHCVLAGELKRHGIINPQMWTGEEAANANRIWLGKELRGYCHKYTSAAGAVFDGKYLLILIFLARDGEAVRSANCQVQGLLFKYTDTYLRYALYRTASRQLRRCQAQTAPEVNIDGYARHFEWWSGVPYWVDANRQTFYDHPNGHTRTFDAPTGAWFWATPNGSVWDTLGLW
ncbi:hypothetical protein F5Y17DRAFT_470514 [Xylariaceae sp. FL0594]|nr:hypothetical protein F5Y17DRAFT_470514 [Xylariaceae sp. FL0594]